MSKRGGFQELFFSTIMPKVYGIGAAIVIVGALFKIQHYEGAGLMLGIGLGTDFKVKFQQYDNFPIPTDGRGYDEIQIVGGPFRGVGVQCAQIQCHAAADVLESTIP